MTLLRAIRLVMLAIFAALVYQVTAASLRPPTSMRVYGSASVTAGRTARFYITCLDADGLSPCQAASCSAQLVHQATDGNWRPITAPQIANASHVVRLSVPEALPPGPLALAVHVQDGARTPADSALVPLQAPTSERGAQASRFVPGQHLPPIVLRCVEQPEGQDAPSVVLWPDDGVVVAGLTATGSARLGGLSPRALRLAGVPHGALVLETGEGQATDAAAQALPAAPMRWQWHAAPQPKRTPWQLRRMPPQGPCAVLQADVHHVPRQLSLSLGGHGFVPANTALRIVLRTLPFCGPVHVDVWLGQALVDGTDMTAGVWTYQVPQDAHGPLMVTAYRQSMAPKDTQVTQVAWVTAGDTPNADDVAQMADWFGAAAKDEGTRAQAAASAGLGALARAETLFPVAWIAEIDARCGTFVPDAAGAPLLHDSHNLRQGAFAAAQQQRRHLGQRSLVTVLAFGAFCAVAYVRNLMLQRRRRLVMQRLHDDDDAAAQAMTRLEAGSDLWPVVGIVLLMAAGLYELMAHLLAAP